MQQKYQAKIVFSKHFLTCFLLIAVLLMAAACGGGGVNQSPNNSANQVVPSSAPADPSPVEEVPVEQSQPPEEGEPVEETTPKAADAAAQPEPQEAPPVQDPPTPEPETSVAEQGPEAVARLWLIARTTDDVETAVKLSCPAEKDLVKSTSEWIAEVNSQTGGGAEELSDISGVTFRVASLSGDTADVYAQGDFTVAFKGEPFTSKMDETYIMKQIDGAWYYCGAGEK